VVPKFLTSVMGSDPLLPLYQLVSGLAATRVGATTDATLSIYLRASCASGAPDSLQFAENVVASWGLPSSVWALRSDRALRYAVPRLRLRPHRIRSDDDLSPDAAAERCADG